MKLKTITVIFFETSSSYDCLTNGASDRSSLSKFTIYHQNLCGISNKKDELEVYLNELQDIEFICVSEHFLNKAMISQFTFPNYILSSFNTRSNKIRGGTLIRIRTDRLRI